MISNDIKQHFFYIIGTQTYQIFNKVIFRWIGLFIHKTSLGLSTAIEFTKKYWRF